MLKDIFRNHKWSIGITYLIFFVEFGLFAMLPWMLGEAVDHLINHKYGFFIGYIALCTAGLGIGFFRRRLDTRVFIGIWIVYTTKAVANLIEKKIDPAKIASRSSFVKHYSDFFEYTMPVMVSNSVNIIISLVMIFLAAWQAGCVVLVTSLVGLVASYLWACKIQQVEIATQETREEIHGAILTGNIPVIEEGYKEQLKRHVQRSDMEANVWSVIDVLATASDVAIIWALIVWNPGGGPYSTWWGPSWPRSNTMGVSGEGGRPFSTLHAVEEFGNRR